MWIGYVTLPNGPDGKRRRKKVSSVSKSGAVAKLKVLRADLDKAGDLPTSSPLLSAWLDQWLERIARPRLKPRTLEGYRGQVERYIKPSIGTVRLDRLTPEHVRKMHAYVTDGGRSTTTALQAHRILAKALTDAVREGRVMRNAAQLLDAPTRAVVEREALTAEQAVMLLRSIATDPMGARWVLALMAGMRQGECLGLTWDMVDLETGIITVAWQSQRLAWNHGCGPAVGGRRPCGMKRGGNCPERQSPIPDGQEGEELGRGLWLIRPKSRRSWRRIVMPDFLIEVLRRHRDTHPGRFAFTADDGLPVDPSDDYQAWMAALDAAGLPRVPLHSARHTTATLLYALGVPEQTRMEILGHSSATTTAGYTHVDVTMQREAMRQLGVLLALES